MTRKLIAIVLFLSFSLACATADPRNELTLYQSTGAYTGDLWFREGTSVADIKTGANAISVELTKKLLRNRIDKWWATLQQYFPFENPELAYAFFIGEATMESTLMPGVETAIAPWGENSAHAYGPLQTAETAYSSTFPNWMVEDVPNFPQAPLTPVNFYDPVVSVDMGLRKACWFSLKAREEMILKTGYNQTSSLRDFGKDPDFWMLVINGFNTGWATFKSQVNGKWITDPNWYAFYGTWSPAMSAWYYKENHLYDNVNTWHTDARIDPYCAHPYDWITTSITAAPSSAMIIRQQHSVNLTKPMGNGTVISLFDAKGLLVRSNASGALAISTLGLASGIYFVKVASEHRILFTKSIRIK